MEEESLRFSKLLVLALAPLAVTQANIIPTSTTIIGTGPYIWTYNLQLSSDQNVNSGTAPTSDPVPHDNLTFGGFLTIYDFAGYVDGSCAGPSGWTCTAQGTGFTPDDVVPVDNPGIVNITWAYTSGPILLGQPDGLDLGLFSAVSIFGLATEVSYTARGVANVGAVGTIADNVGNTQGPLAADSLDEVPEPLTLVSLGLGLVVLGLVRGKAGRRKGGQTE